MKKLLLLGALLVVGATSFGAKYVLKGDAGTYSGSGSVRILTEGTIMAAPTDPMLEIITGAASGPGDELHFNFGSIFVGETSTEMADFIARIVKYDMDSSSYKELSLTGTDGTTATMKAELEVKDLKGTKVTAQDANGFYSFDIYDIADTDATGTSIGSLGYSMVFDQRDGMSYQGKVTARVEATEVGEFLDQNNSVVVTVENFKE